MSRLRLGLIVAVLLALAVSLIVAWQSWRSYLATPINVNASTVFEIEPGSSLAGVARELQQLGWINRPQWLVWLARSRGDTARIRAGEYRVEAGLTPPQLLDLFVGGEVVQHSFTIIEGTTFRDIRSSLRNHPVVVQTLEPELTPEQVMEALSLGKLHPEGQFLPETYYFTRGTTDAQLLLRAHEAMNETLAEAWSNRAANAPASSPYEALILASIIEKETALDPERAQIAGVFARRLATGMRLQSDPTVIYGLGVAFDGNIRRRDLSSDTPYNTYTRHGLPPTPIAMPGSASIRAALNPAPGDALYFVATGDPDGSHYFSATLDEHNSAVQRYLQRLRSRP